VELDTSQRVYNAIAEGLHGIHDTPIFSEGIGDSNFKAAEVLILALFDICNAFPRVSHAWVFAVLHCLGLSKELICIIKHLYTNCAAYSCGIGDGGLLFYVLAGVRTGCPLSACLFISGFNPFVWLINFISDGPKLSKTCVCADGVGSCLRALKHLKIQYNVWKLAARVANLCLKPSKCFLVVTKFVLTDGVKLSISNWLRAEIPAWKDFQIVSSGKYLGVFLGVDGIRQTFDPVESKYLSRCYDLSQSVATALPSVIRYNGRCVPVFSYVAQVMLHHDFSKLKLLDQRGVHKVLKMPPNCMSQKLCHTFDIFCPISPRPIVALCLAAHSRFAKAEAAALRLLHSEALEILGDSMLVRYLPGNEVPYGNISYPPLLQELINSLSCQGCYRPFLKIWRGPSAPNLPMVARRERPPSIFPSHGSSMSFVAMSFVLMFKKS
jgi:hypothetical protein